MAAQVDMIAIAYELENLQLQTEAARAKLLDGDEQANDESLESLASHREVKEIRSKFRLTRKDSIIMPPIHTIASERSSLDSQSTLINSLPYRSPPKDDTLFLSLLAPLVACLQRLTPSILIASDHDLRTAQLKACDDLSDLIQEIKKETLFSLGPHSKYDNDDMRLLLLTALHKKVLSEKVKCTLPQPCLSTSPLFPIKATNSSFILHSSSLAEEESVAIRTPTPPKAIAPLVKVPEGGFSEFMGHSQQTWRMNVHRLGSFQASALFSPSPIAVNKAMRIGAGRL